MSRSVKLIKVYCLQRVGYMCLMLCFFVSVYIACTVLVSTSKRPPTPRTHSLVQNTGKNFTKHLKVKAPYITACMNRIHGDAIYRQKANDQRTFDL